MADGFEWKTGYRFHDTEDDGTENQHSDSFHLAGEFSDEGIKHEFCIKMGEEGGGRLEDTESPYTLPAVALSKIPTLVIVYLATFMGP